MEASKAKYTNKMGDPNSMQIDSLANEIFNDERRCEFFDDYSNRRLFNQSNMAGCTMNFETMNPEYSFNQDLKLVEKFQLIPIKKQETPDKIPDPQFIVKPLLLRF